MTDTPKPFFFFVGKPASGKETQAKLLAQAIDYSIFMSGAKFRDLMQSGSYLGRRIKKDYETGALLPAWIADFLFQDFVLNLGPETGAIFEGSARDLDQVKTIEKVSNWLGRPYYIINLEVGDETVLARSLARGRDAVDSNEAVIRNRLADYERLTRPAINYFCSIDKCFTVDGEDSPEKIHAQIFAHIERYL